MKIDVYILCRNEADILPYTLRHYLSFARYIYIYEGRSTDGCRAIIEEQQKAHPGQIAMIDWPDGQMLDDINNSRIKSICWRGSDADWVILVDCDEFVYFPVGLDALAAARGAVIVPYGWELLSDQYPSTAGQIYSEVRLGASDDRWYGKPVILSPHGVVSACYEVGAHAVDYMTTDCQRRYAGPESPRSNPPVWLLHCKHLGPVERVAARYDAVRASYSETNRKHGWGHQVDGLVHAKAKRTELLARARVIL